MIYSDSPLPCIEKRLAFILSFWKLNPLQEHHADLFCMTQKQCCKLIHGLGEILQRALKRAGVVPDQTDRELQESLSKEETSKDKLLLHDGTELEIPRPADDELQKDRYSGKKKKHTVKNAVLISGWCLIVHVSQTFSGRVHDKTIADNCYSIPQGYAPA